MGLKRVHVAGVILALISAAILYLVLVTWSRYRKVERFTRAYEAIKIGDSREVVVAALGEPQSVTDCTKIAFSDQKREADFRAKCSQRYEYVSLMARYTISFDRNGAVFNKSEMVSP
jgi:hypothetical protein